MLHDLDVQLFLLINASEHASKFMISFAVFCAQSLIYVPVIMMFVLWFVNSSYRQLIIKMLIGLTIAMMITFLIRHVIYLPRPFAVNIGYSALYHEMTSSLPSQHAVFIWAMCLTIYLNYAHRFKKLLYTLVIIAFLVCWGRIYVGVHWPSDMVASFFVSLFSTYLTYKFWFVIKKVLIHFSLRKEKNSIL